jgi:hypothetical protein
MNPNPKTPPKPTSVLAEGDELRISQVLLRAMASAIEQGLATIPIERIEREKDSNIVRLQVGDVAGRGFGGSEATIRSRKE